MIFIEVIADIVMGILDSIGGWHYLFARRYVMPVVLGIVVSAICKSWWVGILVWPVMGTLCLGYFSGHNWGRALWLFLQAVMIGLGLTITGHLHWYIYVPYCIGAGIFGGIYKNWKQTVGDFITGSYLGLIIFFIK